MSVAFDGWSRGDLLREARRRGVPGAGAMTREQLLLAVRTHVEEGARGRRARALGLARAVVGRVVTMAAGALPETPRRILASLAPRLSASGAERPVRPSPSRARTPAPPPRAASPDPSEAASGIARSKEPIQTLTMARLLADQGHHARALAIYETLSSARPDDEALIEETARVREAAGARRAKREAERPREDDPDQEVVLVAVDPSTLLVSWEVGHPGVLRARAMLGTEGVLTARVVLVAPDPERLIRSETRERRGVETLGEWVVTDVPEGARATASVGLCEGGRFVSIAHAPTLRA